MPNLSNAKRFVEEIRSHLENELHLHPMTEYRLGRDRSCSMADIAIDLGGTKIFIEVEEGQPHPDTNVTKYWYWIEQRKIDHPVFLIHVFGKEFYNKNYISRTRLCEFIAEKIHKAKRNFHYYPIPKEKHHPYSDDWTLLTLLGLTKTTIKTIIKS